jgi:hypothetical protein
MAQKCLHSKEVHRIQLSICPSCEPALAERLRQSQRARLAFLLARTDWAKGFELPTPIVRATLSLIDWLNAPAIATVEATGELPGETDA